MSAASRLAAADRQIERPRDPNTGKFVPVNPDNRFGSLALNRCHVPGGISTEPLPGFITVASLRWDPEDAGPHAASIGYACAVEHHRRGVAT